MGIGLYALDRFRKTNEKQLCNDLKEQQVRNVFKVVIKWPLICQQTSRNHINFKYLYHRQNILI